MYVFQNNMWFVKFVHQDKTSNLTFFQWNEFATSAGFTAGLRSVQCSKLLPVRQLEADNFGGGLETFWKLFNFMFMIWDSRQQDWQLFLLSFEHWSVRVKFLSDPTKIFGLFFSRVTRVLLPLHIVHRISMHQLTKNIQIPTTIDGKFE